LVRRLIARFVRRASFGSDILLSTARLPLLALFLILLHFVLQADHVSCSPDSVVEPRKPVLAKVAELPLMPAGQIVGHAFGRQPLAALPNGLHGSALTGFFASQEADRHRELELSGTDGT